MTRSETIRKVLGPFHVGGKAYHSPLPPELAEWYCYASDAGHSILVILTRDYKPGVDLTDALCPAPVKAVLRGWKAEGGYVVCDLPYSSQVGLQTDPADDER